MDWLGFEFCVIIWVLSISQLQAEPPDNEDLKCVQGQIIPPPDECNTCICFEEEIHCTRLVCSPKNDTGAEPECISGDHIPKPDDCNDCICFGGEIHCSNKPCNRSSRIGPVCDDSQPVYRPDECNECYCFEGRLECSDLVCIRGSKCVEGQEIPKPDSCNMCKCHEGHILCTNHQCPNTISKNSIEPDNLSAEMQSLPQCEEGDYIPPPPPPDDCNTCLCINNRVLCTMETCALDVPDISGRFKEQQTNNYLQSFDKPISVEPFINMLSKNSDKTPTKLIHTHEYNGFHQEIKVHTKHLPKDKTKLLAALANTLNNPALADIGNNIKETSSNSPYNHPVPTDENSLLFKQPLHEENIAGVNSLDSSEIHLTHLSKLITSGSQSNETILLIPEPSDIQNTKSVIPLTKQYEKYWDTISSPAPQYKNMHQIIPYSTGEEKILEYYSEYPPSYISSVDEYKIIRNPAKFGRPGQHSIIKPTNPTRNTVDIPDQYTESVIPLNRQSTYSNDENLSYMPFHQDDKQYKEMPSAIITNPYELQPLPDQIARPTYHPVYRPDQDQSIVDSDKEGSPPRYLLEPNPDRFNLSQNDVQSYQKPHLPTLNNKSVLDNPIEKQNQPTVSTPPQFGIKPYQAEPKVKSHPMNSNYFTPPNSGLIPDQEKRISITDNGDTAQMPSYGKSKPISTVYHRDELFSPMTEFLPDKQGTPDTVLHISQPKPIPSKYNQDLYKPHSKVSHIFDDTQDKRQYSLLEPHSMDSIKQYNAPEIELKPNYFKPDPEKHTTIPHKDGIQYNTPHSHYETYSKITNVTQYDPSQFGQNNTPLVKNKLDKTELTHIAQKNSPYQFHFHPDHEQNVSDLTIAKVYHYLNQPYHNDSNRWENKTNQVQPKLSQLNKYYPPGPVDKSQYDQYKTPLHKYPHIQSKSPIKSNQNAFRDPYTPIENQFKPRYPKYDLPQSHRKPEGFNNQGYQPQPAITKNSQYQPSLSQLKPYDRPKPLIFGHQGSNDVSYVIPGSVEDLSTPKINSHKSRPSQFRPIQTRPKSIYFYDRGSVDKFQHKPHLAVNFAPSEVNKYKSPESQFRFPPDQSKPGMFDNHAPKNEFQHTVNSGEDLVNTKVNQFKPRHPHYILPQNKQNPKIKSKDRGSAGGFQYTVHSGEDPMNIKVNQFKPVQTQHILPQNHQNPGIFDDRGSTDGFQYTSHSGEDPTNTKVNKIKPAEFEHTFPQNHQNPETIDDRGSAGGFQSDDYTTNIKVNKYKSSHTQYIFPQNHQNPQTFSDRGSAGLFQYTPHSGEYSTNTKVNEFKPPQSQHIFPQNPGIFDDRGSADGFQYISNSGEEPTNSIVNEFKPPQSQHIFPQNQQNPGTFDDRGSADGFQYTSNSGEEPTNTKISQFNAPELQHIFPQNQQNPGTFDDRGSADGFQYTSNSGEEPTNTKVSQFKAPELQHIFPQNQQNPQTFDDRGSNDGFQYTSHSGEKPTNTKVSQFKAPQLQHIFPQNHQNPQTFDDRGSADGFQYTSHSGEEPTNTKVNEFKSRDPQHLLPQNPGTFDDRGAADGFQYISHSGEEPTNTKVNLINPAQSQHIFPQHQQNPKPVEDRGFPDRYQFISDSAENPTNSKFKQAQEIFKSWPFADRKVPDGVSNKPSVEKSTLFKTKQYDYTPWNFNFNPKIKEKGQSQYLDRETPDGGFLINPSVEKYNPFKTKKYDYNPWSFNTYKKQPEMDHYQNFDKKNPDDVPISPSVIKSNPFKTKQYDYDPWNSNKPDHDQYKPSSIDSLLNGAHHIPWLQPKREDTTKRPRLKPEQDQYKPSSVDSLLNGIHEIPWSENTNFDLHSMSSKPDESKNKPSVFDDFSWFVPKQNHTLAKDKDALQSKQDNNMSTSFMDVIDSDSNKYNQVHPRLKPNNNQDNSFFSNDVKVPNTSNRFSPLLSAVKNFIELTSTDDPEDDDKFAIGAMDHLQLLPYLFPTIFKNITFKPSSDPDEIREIDKRLDSWSVPGHSNPKLPTKVKETINMLLGNQNKLDLSKYNGTINENNPGKLSKQDIEAEISKIFSKPPQTKFESTKNIVENSESKYIQTTTPYSATESINNYQNPPRNKKVPDKNLYIPPVQYPDVHIILHQPNVVDDTGSREFLEKGLVNQVTDINAEDLASFLPKILHPRFRYRPKDQKEECGEGTEWISNCHGCSCHDGMAICFEIPGCNLKPFGEPMICKPYSRFKMGNCYSCECNGDGVAECDASDCKEDEEGKDASNDLALPVYHNFFDEKKTRDLLQYYSFYKKLPKDCSSQTVYPTCEAGTRWVSRCNKCECDESGKHKCTPIDDCVLDYESYGKPTRCKPNSKFYPKSTGMPCVECHCDDEGNPYCPSIDYKQH